MEVEMEDLQYIYNENDTPGTIALKINLFYPQLDFTFDISGNELTIHATLGVLKKIHHMVMWHYIPQKCKESATVENYEKNEGYKTYKF